MLVKETVQLFVFGQHIFYLICQRKREKAISKVDYIEAIRSREALFLCGKEHVTNQQQTILISHSKKQNAVLVL